MAKTVIIGNGISGVTTARQLRKLNSSEEILIISSETQYFFSRTALMYVFMGHMKFEHTKPYENSFWKKNRLNLHFGRVTDIDFERKLLNMEKGKAIAYDKLVLALGSKPNFFNWPGQHLKGVQGLYSYQDLIELEENTAGCKRAAIVGGGLIGVELAEMLLSRKIEVHFLIRESHFWGNVLHAQESEMIMQHMQEHGIFLHTGQNLQEILGENDAVVGIKTSEGLEIECSLVGITTGVRPNIDFLKESKLKTDKGILVNQYLETNIPNVYALGDCAQFVEAPKGRRTLEQVWYTGRMMGEVLAKTLNGQPTCYEPGPWFNSAKFFDIEYQTYGLVPAQIEENTAEFIWKHSSQKKLLRFVYDSNTQEFKGMNSFGIRWRHHAFDQWLREKRDIEFVMKNLNNALFDPEFFKSDLKEVLGQFNSNWQLKKKDWKDILNFYSEA